MKACEETTYRGYSLRVYTDKVIVRHPHARSQAEFLSMSTARKFVRTMERIERRPHVHA